MLLTALGLYAFDTASLSTTSQTGNVASLIPTPRCPEGMAEVDVRGNPLCVDRYEASASSTCPHIDPRTQADTLTNIQTVDCSPVSTSGRIPWRHVSRTQAQLACAKAGKRLPTAEEWYKAALGTPDSGDLCNTDAGILKESGANESCVSLVGMYDMVGNVWEWVDEDVTGGVWNGRTLPASGYISEVDVDGVAISVAATPSQYYTRDRFWLDEEGVRGMTRGGYYKSGTDAGLFATFAASPPSFTGTAVGFRCVQSM